MSNGSRAEKVIPWCVCQSVRPRPRPLPSAPAAPLGGCPSPLLLLQPPAGSRAHRRCLRSVQIPTVPLAEGMLVASAAAALCRRHNLHLSMLLKLLLANLPGARRRRRATPAAAIAGWALGSCCCGRAVLAVLRRSPAHALIWHQATASCRPVLRWRQLLHSQCLPHRATCSAPSQLQGGGSWLPASRTGTRRRAPRVTCCRHPPTPGLH